jgi:hypothetical protein
VSGLSTRAVLAAIPHASRAMRLGIAMQDTLCSVNPETRLMGRRREALHRVAPGYNPSALLVPKSASTAATSPSATAVQGGLIGVSTMSAGTVGLSGGSSVGVTQTQMQTQAQSPASDPMDDLVSRLEEMESRR